MGIGDMLSNLFGGSDDDDQEPADATPPTGPYVVHLVDSGSRKIQVIKVIRELTSLGLRGAKDLAESTPVQVVSFADEELARQGVVALREVGATAEMHGPLTTDSEEEHSSYYLVIEGYEQSKLHAIKVVREATGYGLLQSKEVVDHVPSKIGPFPQHIALQALMKLTDEGISARLV